MELTWLQPDGLPLGISILLIVCSAVTSFLSVAAGIGGGIVLLTIMASLMPTATLIPVHGAVQIGSNAGRMLIMLRQVQWGIFLPFLLGSTVGIAVGGAVLMQLPAAFLQIGLSGFILWSTWSKPRASTTTSFAIILLGFISAFLTMFFGATGIFVAARIKRLQLERFAHIATHATFMVTQHGLKTVVFGLFGFAYVPYLPLIILMVGSGILGTLVGRWFLIRMTDERFHFLLSSILTILALRLLWQGLMVLAD